MFLNQVKKRRKFIIYSEERISFEVAMDPSAVSAFSAYQAAKSPARKNSGQQKSKKREQSSQKNGAPPQKKSKVS